MRMIGSASDEHGAKRFCDYLLSLGVEARPERLESDGTWAVWVVRDDDLDQARAEFERFLANPTEAKYAEAGSKAEELRAERAKTAARRRRNYIDIRGGWTFARVRPGPVSMALIAFSVIVALASAFGSKLGPLDALLMVPVTYHDGYISFPRVTETLKRGEVWRLVTPILIHRGVIHLMFNMLMLYRWGSMIEARKGSLMLVVLVLASAIPSNLAQFRESGPMFGGMSGVVYALFGYVWMKGRLQPGEGMMIDRTTVYFMIAWLFLCMTGWLGPIANTAHVVGLVMGVAFGAAPHFWQRARRGR